jgi:hypothetical protein
MSQARSKPIHHATASSTESTAKPTSVGAIKGGKAPASLAKVKLEALDALSKRISCALTLETDGLPGFAKAGWTASFLPTLYSYLSAANNPWELYAKGSNLVKTIQNILDTVYPGSQYEVQLGDKIFTMVGHNLIGPL